MSHSSPASLSLIIGERGHRRISQTVPALSGRRCRVRGRVGLVIAVLASLSACSFAQSEAAGPLRAAGSSGSVIAGEVLESFESPWAMAFLPDEQAVVTEKGGGLWLIGADGEKQGPITNGPVVEARGQGGLGDLIVATNFETSGTVYLSYVERDASNADLSGSVVERAELRVAADGGELTARQIIWRQTPKVSGNGHYSHRLVLSPDGHLFITSGERQKFDPAQDMDSHLGKIVRLQPDGSVPADNPFAGDGPVAEQIWSLGHRNLLGIDFDASGQLWAHEMGPRGGDELNRILPGANYGYPEVSNGSHYSGVPIPDHDTNPAFEAPAVSWNPSISPSGLVIYDGDRFPGWAGNAVLGGLSSKALLRVRLSAEEPAAASEVERFSWGRRVREVEQAPDGSIWTLEDGRGGRLIRWTPES